MAPDVDGEGRIPDGDAAHAPSAEAAPERAPGPGGEAPDRRRGRKAGWKDAAGAAMIAAGIALVLLGPVHEWAGISSNSTYGPVDLELMAAGAVSIIAGVALFLLMLRGERNSETLLAEGDGLYARGEYGRALELYERALALDPGHAPAWARRGSALEMQGELDAARTALERALEIAPDDHLALSALAAVLRRKGDPAGALALAERATRASPGYGVAWLNRANALADLGRREEALDALARALEADPGYGKAWFNKGVVLMLLGRRAEALDCFDEALDISPGDPRTLKMREKCLARPGAADAEG
jgi:tetratricopeptide (TPR) repeat protein